MIEIQGDLWKQTRADAICFTSNGYVNAEGKAVMGAGTAKQAKARFPGLDKHFAKLLKTCGNLPIKLSNKDRQKIWLVGIEIPYHVVSFPVKPITITANASNLVDKYAFGITIPKVVPGWMAKASLTIIEDSCRCLTLMAALEEWQTVVLPKPGCGAGELDWEKQVKPLVADLLDNRFYIIDK